MEKEKVDIDKLINGLFYWVGFIGTLILVVSEVALLMVMILGFNNSMSMNNTIIISGVLAVFALGVTWLMTIQGIKFAEDKKDNKVIMAEYNKRLVDNVKVLKTHGLGRFWVVKIIKDIVVKGVILGGSTGFMITFFISGSGDWGIMGLALNSILLSVTMGMLSLSKGYKFYDTTYMLHIKRKNKAMREEDMKKEEDDRFKREFVSRKKRFLEVGLQKIENDLALVPAKEDKNE